MVRNRSDVSTLNDRLLFLLPCGAYAGCGDQMCSLAGARVLHTLRPIFRVH
jgi:hypothetical protein